MYCVPYMLTLFCFLFYLQINLLLLRDCSFCPVGNSPWQIKYEEELGRGAFGVAYKATLKRRVGIEVFDTEKTTKPEEPCQVVAVKVLKGKLL